MDDFEFSQAAGEPHTLAAWALSPHRDGLLLGLKYAASSDADASENRRIQVLMPPEAALHLSRELARQATKLLERQEPRGR